MDIFGVIVQPTMVRVPSGGLEGLGVGPQDSPPTPGATPLRGLPAWALIPLGFCALPSGAVPVPKASVLVSSLFPEGSSRWTEWSSVVAGVAHCPRGTNVILVSSWRAGSTKPLTAI